MKNTSRTGFIKFMYWLFKIIFWIQLTAVILLISLNYFMYDSEQGLYFTVRGNIYAYNSQLDSESKFEVIDSNHNNSYTTKNKYGVVSVDTNGSNTIYFLNPQQIGFMRIDYSDFVIAFNFKNVVWTLSELFIYILWIFITYQIMKILQSIKDKSVFNYKNIKRITFIGWAFILLPIIELARDQLFFLIIKQHIKIQGLTFISNFNWFDFLPFSLYGSTSMGTMDHNSFPGIALGLVILVIAFVFKNGLELQNEKDLTI